MEDFIVNAINKLQDNFYEYPLFTTIKILALLAAITLIITIIVG